MSRQLYMANPIHGRRRFSSASDVCGLSRCRQSASSITQPSGRSGIGGYSTRSLLTIGGSRRISCIGGYQIGGYGGLTVGHHITYGGQSYCGIPRSYVALRNYAGSCENDPFHEVSINEHLLKPLCIEVDPEIQKVRTKEKEQMKSLNNQFACFIDQVRCLEQRNKVLVTKWNILQEQVPPARRDLDSLFANCIRSLRKQLNVLQNEKEQMEPQLQNIQQSVEELKCRYEEEINQRTAAENDFVLLKKDVDGAFLNKVELEAKVETMKREAEFLRCVYNEEVALLENQIQCQTAVMMHMDKTQDPDLTTILQNVESWYQSIAQRSKEEVKTLYQNRYQELQDQRCQISNDLKTNKREISELNRMVQRLQCELEKTKKQVACLQLAICDSEQRGDCSFKDAQEKYDDLHSALHRSKDDLACMVQNYQELLNDKLALDIEIATYKSLLEGEENRIFSGKLTNVGKVAEGCGHEPAYASLSRGLSSRSGKYSPCGPGKSQKSNLGLAECYGVGYTSRNVGKLCIPGSEDFSPDGGYHITSGGSKGKASRAAQRPRGASCATGGCTTAIVAGRSVSGYSSAGNSAGACCHGHSCNRGMKVSSCFTKSSNM